MSKRKRHHKTGVNIMTNLLNRLKRAKRKNKSENYIKDLENGTGVYKPKIVEKIEKALNVKFERSWKK